MDRRELIEFVRIRGLGVVATTDAQGRPEAALVGVAATGRGEIVFDTTRHARKLANIERQPFVALVVGWDDEVTVQLEGRADVPAGDDQTRCREAYFDQFPDGRRRAGSPDIVHVRVVPSWVRHADYRPDGTGIVETVLDEAAW